MRLEAVLPEREHATSPLDLSLLTFLYYSSLSYTVSGHRHPMWINNNSILIIQNNDMQIILFIKRARLFQNMLLLYVDMSNLHGQRNQGLADVMCKWCDCQPFVWTAACPDILIRMIKVRGWFKLVNGSQLVQRLHAEDGLHWARWRIIRCRFQNTADLALNN